MMSTQTAAFFGRDGVGWTPSFYRAECLLTCDTETAWKPMLNYYAWNPGFVGARMTRICGTPDSAGEIVLIGLVDANGAALAEFYASTLLVVPGRRVVWYAYPKEGNAFRNFIQFALLPRADATVFSIDWYAVDMVADGLLPEHRAATARAIEQLTNAFRTYCAALGEHRKV